MLRINMARNFKPCIALIAAAVLLTGCRASPLYIGQFGKNAIATAPGAVLRDNRGEPIMDNLPPLGAIPVAENRQAQLQVPQE
jgi:hypothetical protein